MRGSGRNRVQELAADHLPGPEADALLHGTVGVNLVLDRECGRVCGVVDTARRIVGDVVANRLPDCLEAHLAVALRRDLVVCDTRCGALLPADKGVTDAARGRQRDGLILNRIRGREVTEPLNRAVARLAEVIVDCIVVRRPACRNRLVARRTCRNARDGLTVRGPAAGVTAAYRRRQRDIILDREGRDIVGRVGRRADAAARV